jgi:hypothetical protein
MEIENHDMEIKSSNIIKATILTERDHAWIDYFDSQTNSLFSCHARHYSDSQYYQNAQFQEYIFSLTYLSDSSKEKYLSNKTKVFESIRILNNPNIIIHSLARYDNNYFIGYTNKTKLKKPIDYLAAYKTNQSNDFTFQFQGAQVLSNAPTKIFVIKNMKVIVVSQLGKIFKINMWNGDISTYDAFKNQPDYNKNFFHLIEWDNIDKNVFAVCNRNVIHSINQYWASEIIETISQDHTITALNVNNDHVIYSNQNHTIWDIDLKTNVVKDVQLPSYVTYISKIILQKNNSILASVHTKNAIKILKIINNSITCLYEYPLPKEPRENFFSLTLPTGKTRIIVLKTNPNNNEKQQIILLEEQ